MKDDRVYLSHIRDAIAQIETYATGGEEVFSRERIVQDAVIRNLEIIGEAARHLSEDLRARHPEIPWMRIAGLRDVLIHEYFGVRMDTCSATETIRPAGDLRTRPRFDRSRP